jgi:Zn-finger nucleic acid-binding protein
LCPRCGDVLDEVFESVSACVRCAGLWLAQPAIERAFHDPEWPPGPTAWWGREVRCPVCMSEGQLTVMEPRVDGNVVVDRCPSHGVWLDAGELGRVLGVADGLAVLYVTLFGTELTAEKRKQLSPEELAQKRVQAEEHKLWLDRLVAEAEQDAGRMQQQVSAWQAECDALRADVTRIEDRLLRARRNVRESEQDLTAARVRLKKLESKPPNR